MALSNSTGLVSEAGGDTEEVVAWFWPSLLVRGRESLLGGSGGPAEADAEAEAEADAEAEAEGGRGSDGATLTSVGRTRPASIWEAEVLPEGVGPAGVVRLFPCWPGDTYTNKDNRKTWN